MPEVNSHKSTIVTNPEPQARASFILRCWQTDDGQMRALLIDVETGARHPVTDLSQITAVMQQLLPPSASDPDDHEDIPNDKK